jgi:hypothetical protein
MKLGLPVRVAAPVSASLLAFAPQVQALLGVWRPYLHEITVEAKAVGGAETDGMLDGRGVGLYFSGGVDSFYSLLKNRAEITHVIFVHGFDTLMSNPGVRARNVRSMRQAAAELGKPLIEVETNWRDVVDAYEGWSHHTATAAQMAISLLLAPQFRKVYIAENYSYFGAKRQCNIPLEFAAAGVSMVLDGSDCTRLDKTVYIASSDTALRWLRVCWQNQSQAYNCCRCEKCLRTMVALHLAGALDRCRTFDQPIDLERVRNLDFDLSAFFWLELLVGLEQRTDRPDLTAAVRDSIGWSTAPARTWPAMLAEMERTGDHPEIVAAVRAITSKPPLSDEQRTYAQRLARATTRVFDLERELRVIKSSQSWKLTAPLRNLALRVRTRRRSV